MSLGYWDRPGIGILYGCAMVKGLMLLFIDNSNYQVDTNQLEFTRVQVASVGRDTPIVILLHIPLMLPGVTLPAKELCGHAQWGAATDTVLQLHCCRFWGSVVGQRSTEGAHTNLSLTKRRFRIKFEV